MEFSLYDVSHGSCGLLKSPTGKYQVIDCGSSTNYSPLNQIYNKELKVDEKLHSIIVTHHHGDHINDIFNIGQPIPGIIVRRPLEGAYAKAVQESNSKEGNQAVDELNKVFSNHTSTVSKDVWG